MTRRRIGRPAAAMAVLALAASALLTACGPSGQQDGGSADNSQVQQMQQKVDAADSAAAQADENAGQDN
ncbi:hypothetical protein AB0K51_32540 [Kitasatospora sp. NPDC049285]|uniref:hypothetical protein n=1 Tax=Kitasatospora sp. NPDC049285 TaxID=3157096 RepID=UPI00343BA7C4